jgi:cell cycle arrest protein BUB3
MKKVFVVSSGVQRQVKKKYKNFFQIIDIFPFVGSLYTGSWDATIQVWDPRSQASQQTVNLPDKVFSMDLLNNKLAVAMAGRRIHIYDVRNMSQPWQVRDTTLKYMLKCIRLMPNVEGFACSSVEGRVALEFFESSREDKKYAFKSHRQVIYDNEVVYPVNALAFHPT